MAKNIDPKLKKIGEYLKLEKQTNFLIPEYQRAYSWEIKHCDKLWQDIEGFIESGGSDPYFFGTIIINCQDNDTKLSLIDGQQRTTTFLLLLKALLIKLNIVIAESATDEDSESLREGLKAKRNRIMSILYKAEDEDIPEMLKNYDKFKDIEILKNESINEIYKTELATILEAVDLASAQNNVTKIPYKQKDNKFTNYFRNFQYFCKKLDKISSSQVNVFAKNILEKCEIIEIRSWQVEQAITMFNSLNSDGMPLLDADIISAQLYSEAVKLNQRDAFNEKWEKLLVVVKSLDAHKIADIDTILMQYMYIHRARKKEYLTDKGSINVTAPGLRRYYTEEIHGKQLLKDPLSLCDELLKISEIWLKIKEYPIIKLLLKFNENVKLYLPGYLSRFNVVDISEENIMVICESLLKLFAILELVDTGYSSAKFKVFLFRENIKLVDKNTDISEMEHDFNEHISRSWTSEELQKDILDYDKNILVFLNEFLFAKDGSVNFIFTEKYDIEHIMPSSGKNQTQIQLDAGISDSNEFMSLVNKLGNKILLEEDINRSIGNEWFRTKVQTSVADKTGYKNSKYAMALALVEKYKEIVKPHWLKEDIERSTIEIAQRILRFIFSN